MREIFRFEAFGDSGQRSAHFTLVITRLYNNTYFSNLHCRSKVWAGQFLVFEGGNSIIIEQFYSKTKL